MGLRWLKSAESGAAGTQYSTGLGDKGLYVTESFASETVGKGPVLILVKGKQAGREITVKETFHLE